MLPPSIFFFFYFFLVFFETTIKIGDRRVSFPLFGSIRSKMKLRMDENYVMVESIYFLNEVFLGRISILNPFLCPRKNGVENINCIDINFT